MMEQRVQTGQSLLSVQGTEPQNGFPLPRGHFLTVLIGREDAMPAAHLLARVYGSNTMVGRMTAEGFAWSGGTLMPLPRQKDWGLLESRLRARADEGCGRIVLAISPKQITARALGGLHCGRAVLCNLRERETDAVSAYLNIYADAVAVNLDDPVARVLAENRIEKPPLTYAELRKDAALTGHGLYRRPEDFTFEAVLEESIARVRLTYPGSYDLYSTLAALAGAVLDGIPLENAARAVNAAPPVAGWYEPLPLPGGGRALLCCHALGHRTLERLLSLAELLQLDGKRVTVVLALSDTHAERALQRQMIGCTCPVVLCPVKELTGKGAGSALLRCCAAGRGGAEWLLCGGSVDWKALLYAAADERTPQTV